MAEVIIHTLTDEQFRGIITDRDQAIEREKRNLELAESVYQQYAALLAGLKHFSKDEVAELLHCSVRQLLEYEKQEKLIPRRIMGKVIYPADRLMAFLKTYDKPDMAAVVGQNLSSFPTRKRNKHAQ